MLKSSYSVFTVIPTSGMIPPMQKQVLKIEFNPRESSGLFTQHWEINTRTDSSDDLKFGDSYNSKVVLNGYAQESLPNKILTSKENLKMDSKQAAATNDRLSIGSNASRNSNKENSSKSVKNKIYIKQEMLEFPIAEPGELTKASIEINNNDD